MILCPWEKIIAEKCRRKFFWDRINIIYFLPLHFSQISEVVFVFLTTKKHLHNWSRNVIYYFAYLYKYLDILMSNTDNFTKLLKSSCLNILPTS